MTTVAAAPWLGMGGEGQEGGRGALSRSLEGLLQSMRESMASGLQAAVATAIPAPGGQGSL